jgi:hypothetical protein
MINRFREQRIDGSDILVAAGRIPNTAGMGLEEAGVQSLAPPAAMAFALPSRNCFRRRSIRR